VTGRTQSYVKRAVRRKRSTLVRLRSFWIVGVFITGLAVWGGISFATAPAFRLKKVDVTGLARVPRDEVERRAGIDRGQNVWLLDARAIAARVEAIPFVRSASVRRLPPATVVIEVTEREPDACVSDGSGRLQVIDRDLRVLENGCDPAQFVTFRLQTPLARAPGAFLDDPELTKLEADAHALGAQPERFSAFGDDAYGQLVATRRDGVEIYFGDDVDLGRKENLIGPILAALGPRASRVRALDVRAPATPVVEYRPPPAPHPHALDRL